MFYLLQMDGGRTKGGRDADEMPRVRRRTSQSAASTISQVHDQVAQTYPELCILRSRVPVACAANLDHDQWTWCEGPRASLLYPADIM